MLLMSWRMKYHPYMNESNTNVTYETSIGTVSFFIHFSLSLSLYYYSHECATSLPPTRVYICVSVYTLSFFLSFHTSQTKFSFSFHSSYSVAVSFIIPITSQFLFLCLIISLNLLFLSTNLIQILSLKGWFFLLFCSVAVL